MTCKKGFSAANFRLDERGGGYSAPDLHNITEVAEALLDVQQKKKKRRKILQRRRRQQRRRRKDDDEEEEEEEDKDDDAEFSAGGDASYSENAYMQDVLDLIQTHSLLQAWIAQDLGGPYQRPLPYGSTLNQLRQESADMIVQWALQE